MLIINGGEGGIWTHGPRERTTVFKTAAFDHSATSPFMSCVYLKGYIFLIDFQVINIKML